MAARAGAVLLAVLAGPAGATDGRPLSAIDWLSRSVETPVAVPEVSGEAIAAPAPAPADTPADEAAPAEAAPEETEATPAAPTEAAASNTAPQEVKRLRSMFRAVTRVLGAWAWKRISMAVPPRWRPGPPESVARP